MTNDIRKWLEDLGLGQYVSVLLEQQVDQDILSELTEADLEKIGLPLGPRKKIIKAIGKLESKHSRLSSEIVVQNNTPDTSYAERRQLTVMFCDLVGSTVLSAAHDPEEMRTVILSFQNECAGVIARFEGFLAKFMGDGVLAYFGYPIAHEDEAERAVRAGLALTKAIAQLKGPTGEALSARVGIATGVVVVGDLIGEGAAQEQAVVGDAPNLAARLQGIAVPGQVVISEATRQLLGFGFTFDDLGKHELKGIGSPVPVTAVVGERSVKSRFDATRDDRLPMVGRDQELTQLLELWTLAKAGTGQTVMLTGEAGIGKSRIVRSLLDSLSNESHTQIQYQCSPYHRGSALWPIIQELSSTINVTANEESTDDQLNQIETLVGQAIDDIAPVAALFASLLGLESTRYPKLDLIPQAQRMQTLDALGSYLLGHAARQPTLLVLEDVHWIDPTTLEFIEQCLERIVDAPVLILMTSRPEQQPEFAAPALVTQLSLARLGQSGVAAIISRLGGDRLPNPTIDAIIARSDGVPLFVEELTKAILETGLTNIPASLHDSLIARLDRHPEVKEIAQIASVLGREFDIALLALVVEQPEARLVSSLDKLGHADLIIRVNTQLQTRYAFKHALVRDAAYNSLLKSHRRKLHGKIAQVIEGEFAKIKNTEPEVLAHHYTQAGQLETAIPLWQTAGKLALSRMALLESIAHLNRGVEILSQLSPSAHRNETEMELCSLLGTAWMALKGWTATEVVTNFQMALKLAKSLERHEALVPIYYGLWGNVLTEGRFADALDWVDEILASAQANGNSDLLVMGHAAGCTTHYWRGDFKQSREHGRRVLDLYSVKQHGHLAAIMNVDPKTYVSLYMCLGQWIVGYPDLAVKTSDEMDVHARAHGHPFDISYALTIGSQLWDFRCEPNRLLASADEAERLGKLHSLPFVSDVLATIFNGIGKVRDGQLEEGVKQLQSGTEIWTIGGAGGMTPYLRATLAEGFARRGDLKRALELIEESLIQIAKPRWEEQSHLAEVLRLKGWMLLLRERKVEAEECYIASLDVARRQEAKSWELRTSTSLARLWQSQGKNKAARDLLAPVYHWFTEGFDTHDLAKAKTLLDELAT